MRISDWISDVCSSDLTERASVKVIAHALRGNVLWSVTEVTAKVEGVHRHLAPGQSLRYIRCDLLERSGGQWGYKPLDESMHPYYYRSEEHTSELQSLMRISYAVFCLKNKKQHNVYKDRLTHTIS